jgi:hypothetical protein
LKEGTKKQRKEVRKHWRKRIEEGKKEEWRIEEGMKEGRRKEMKEGRYEEKRKRVGQGGRCMMRNARFIQSIMGTQQAQSCPTLMVSVIRSALSLSPYISIRSIQGFYIK